MVKLIDHYGINIIKKGKNRYYSPKLKREMIDKVLLEGWFSTKCLPRLWPLKLRVA
ncbi:transposase [Streptococcus thermophilus]|nr:transposase [Streptococcus thermophilus]